MATINTLNVTLVRSVIGRIESHKATVRGLGLRRMHHTVTVQDTPAIRGMINTVNYLLKVSDGTAQAVVAKPAKAAVVVKAAGNVPKKFLTKTGADDLTAVEGIGPKICELLHADGISTFAELADAKISKIEAILKAAGSRYALAYPSTWSEQASLLASGDYAGFEKLAKELDGGVRK
jgi:large subunit ribosomal protein L30